MPNSKQLPVSLSFGLVLLLASLVSWPAFAQPVSTAKSVTATTTVSLVSPQEKAIGGSGVSTNGAVEVVPGSFDLGDIEPGSEHARTFIVRNKSAQPVRIQRSVTSCKCTTLTDIDGNIIAPGDTLEFEAILAAPRTPGVKNAKVQILFDGGLRPLTMELEGDVTMAIKATPAYIGGPRGETDSGVVLLEAIDGKPFSILSVGLGKPRYIGFDPKEDMPRSRYTLQWDVTKISDLSRHIWWVVYTDNPKCTVLPLRIRNTATGSKTDMARFQRYWIFDENVVNAESLVAGVPVNLDVVIKHYNPRGRGQVARPQWRVVKGIRSLSSDATAQLVSTEPVSDEEVRVVFQLTPRLGFSGPLYALITLETDTGVGEFAVLAFVTAGRH